MWPHPPRRRSKPAAPAACTAFGPSVDRACRLPTATRTTSASPALLLAAPCSKLACDMTRRALALKPSALPPPARPSVGRGGSASHCDLSALAAPCSRLACGRTRRAPALKAGRTSGTHGLWPARPQCAPSRRERQLQVQLLPRCSRLDALSPHVTTLGALWRSKPAAPPLARPFGRGQRQRFALWSLGACGSML